MKKRIKQFNMAKWTENRDSKRAKFLKSLTFALKHPLTWFVLCVIIVYGFDL